MSKALRNSKHLSNTVEGSSTTLRTRCPRLKVAESKLVNFVFSLLGTGTIAQSFIFRYHAQALYQCLSTTLLVHPVTMLRALVESCGTCCFFCRSTYMAHLSASCGSVVHWLKVQINKDANCCRQSDDLSQCPCQMIEISLITFLKPIGSLYSS
jgi:hypothetical protein